MARLTRQQIWAIFRDAAFEWYEDKAPRMAAALAFYTVFSLTPIVLISLAVAEVFFSREAALQEIYEQVEFLIGPEGADAIELLLRNVPQGGRSRLATGVGLLTIFFGATAAFTELKDAMNTIWEVQPKPGIGILEMVRDRVLSFAMVLAIGFLLLVSLMISASISAVSRELNTRFPIFWMEATNLMLSIVLITILFALIFKYLPDAQVQWHDVWLGAAVSSVLFAIGKTLFGLYLGHSTIGSAYGAAGSIVIVVLWTYYSALIVLFGAEMTQIQTRQEGIEVLPREKAIHLTEHDRIEQGIPHKKRPPDKPTA